MDTYKMSEKSIVKEIFVGYRNSKRSDQRFGSAEGIQEQEEDGVECKLFVLCRQRTALISCGLSSPFRVGRELGPPFLRQAESGPKPHGFQNKNTRQHLSHQ